MLLCLLFSWTHQFSLPCACSLGRLDQWFGKHAVYDSYRARFTGGSLKVEL